MKVSVVIPNWNGLEFLKTCLTSLDKQTFSDFEVIVVDNGSTDGSINYIEKEFPKYQIIKLPKNIGFSPAVNKGIQKASGKYIALINNDTKVDANCLKYLVEAIEKDPEIGMVAAKMLKFDSPHIIDSAGDYIDAVGHANNIGMGEKEEKYKQGKYIFLVTGGGSLIKRVVFEKIGLLDDDYFAYFEDVDFCLRAQMAGFKAYFEPRAKILHIHKATSRRNPGFTEYLQFRNMTMTIIKNFPTKLFFIDFNLIKIILVNLNTVRFLASIGYLKEALAAELYIIRNFSKLLKKRKKIQSEILVDVDYIIKNIQPKKVTFFGLIKKGI